MRYPLLFPALALLFGTWLLPTGAPVAFLLTLAAASLGAAWIVWARGRTAAAAALASLSLIPAAALNRQIDDVRYSSRLLAPDMLARASTEYVDVTATVLRLPRPRIEGGWEVDLAVDSLDLGRGLSLGCRFNARISVPTSEIDEEIVPLLPGDRVEVAAKLFSTSGFRNPGAFDQAAYLRTEGIHHRGYTKSPGLVHKIADGRLSLRRIAALLRRDFSKRLAGDGDIGERTKGRRVAAALILGEREQLEPAIHESMRRSGLYHLLAISGGNFALFAYLVFALLRVARVAERVRIIVVLVTMLLYAAMVEFEPSVMRAFLMIAVYLAGRFLERDHQLANALAIALAASVVIDPAVVDDYGFQLTFLATDLLILFAPLVSRIGAREGRPGWFRSLTAVNLTATLGLAPYLAYHFNRVTLAGLLLNYIAIPLSGVIMGIGALHAALCHIAAALGRPTAWLLELAGDIFLRLSDLIPAPSILSYRVAPAPPWLVIAFYVLLASVPVFVVRRRRWRAGRVCVTAAVWLLVVTWRFAPRPEGLRFTFIDVGQGDSVLVDFPNGRHMLIDGGGNYDDTFDTGEKVAAPYLLRRGVRSLDYVVISHAHPDHINGLRYIVANFPVKEVWEGINPLGDRYYAKFRTAVPANLVVKQVRRGDRISVGDVDIDVLHPATSERRSVVLNDDSVVLRFLYHGVAALMTGDIESLTESELIESHQKLEAVLLKCPHHGSRTSSTAAFLAAVRPQIAVICVGRGNRWMLPHAEVLEAYKEAGAELLRTDLSGAVSIEIDERGWHRVSP